MHPSVHHSPHRLFTFPTCSLGRHTGSAHVKPGKVQLQLSWSDPFSGSGMDEFQLNTPDELSVRSTIKIQGGEAAYTTIYNRKKK